MEKQNLDVLKVQLLVSSLDNISDALIGFRNQLKETSFGQLGLFAELGSEVLPQVEKWICSSKEFLYNSIRNEWKIEYTAGGCWLGYKDCKTKDGREIVVELNDFYATLYRDPGDGHLINYFELISRSDEIFGAGAESQITILAKDEQIHIVNELANELFGPEIIKELSERLMLFEQTVSKLASSFQQ